MKCKKLQVLFRVAVVVKGDNQQKMDEEAERRNAFEIYDVTM